MRQSLLFIAGIDWFCSTVWAMCEEPAPIQLPLRCWAIVDSVAPGLFLQNGKQQYGPTPNILLKCMKREERECLEVDDWSPFFTVNLREPSSCLCLKLLMRNCFYWCVFKALKSALQRKIKCIFKIKWKNWDFWIITPFI